MGEGFTPPSRDLSVRRIAIDTLGNETSLSSPGKSLLLRSEDEAFHLVDWDMDWDWEEITRWPEQNSFHSDQYIDFFNNLFPKERVERIIQSQMTVCENVAARGEKTIVDNKHGWHADSVFKMSNGDEMVVSLQFYNDGFYYNCYNRSAPGSSPTLYFTGNNQSDVYRNYIGSIRTAFEPAE